VGGGSFLDINWFPGHMAKTLRELKDHLKLVDLVIETCDARIPVSSRNGELRKIMGSKPHILVLNKVDLADPQKTDKWLAWFKEQGECAIGCDSKKRKSLLALEKAARETARLKIEKALAGGRLVRPVRAMIVGIPNTGKSTLINTLIGRKSARTSNMPGLTRQISWLRSGSVLELMDTPGVMPPHLGDSRSRLLLAGTGAIPDDILPTVEIAASLMNLLADLYPREMQERYKLNNLDPETFLGEVALQRGCLLPGGKPDINRFASLFLHELRAGVIGRMTLESPP
jgi:ribosome biogenesis GTPase A